MTIPENSQHGEALLAGGLFPVEMYPDTRLDVEAVKADIARLRAGETVQSQYAIPIGHIDFDVTKLDLSSTGFERYAQVGTIEISPATGNDTAETIRDGLWGLSSEHITDKDRQAIAMLATTFGNVVLADRAANGFGYSPEMSNGVVVNVTLGDYDGLEHGEELHTDNALRTDQSPRIRYVASFGPGKGTASVETPVTNNSEDPGVISTSFSDELGETLPARQNDTGTIERFVAARDAHFSPMESGFRILLDATLTAEPVR